MKQITLAAVTRFEKHERATRKAEFLACMEGLMPWAEFCALIEPHYPKTGNGRVRYSDEDFVSEFHRGQQAIRLQ